VILFVVGEEFSARPVPTGIDGQFWLDRRKGDFFEHAEKSGYLSPKA
jgi:hypothetical protein